MIGKGNNQDQLNLFKPILKQFIDMRHPYVLLAEKIPWNELEKEYKEMYSNTGRPAKSIRVMVSLLILKQMNNLGDETIIEQWIQNPYFQYFSGECEFQWQKPCDPSDLVHFRNRIGEDKIRKILEVSINVQEGKIDKKDVLVDTTAQEKNITYPTDVKLRVKAIEKCNKIAEKEGILLRQSYKRTTKSLVLMQRFSKSNKQKQKAEKAKSKLKTISNRLLRELRRKMTEEQIKENEEILRIMEKAVNQKINDKNKIYSLHEPEVACIAKGKAHKKYEFGSKLSLVLSKDKNLILSVSTFTGNPNDGETLEETLKEFEKIHGKLPAKVIVDRGYQGKKEVFGTIVQYPKNQRLKGYEKQKKRNEFRRRAAIEPVFSHLKYDFRMLRNYLKGHQGDVINSVLACAAFNFKRLYRQLGSQLKFLLDILEQFLLLRKQKLSF